MCEEKFSKWCAWQSRTDFGDALKFPGIYAIAHTSDNLSGKAFKWIEDIIYVGMTNAAYGLRGRLKQFDNTIDKDKKPEHGGADRVLLIHQNYKKLVDRLYVAIAPFKCNPVSNLPADLRIMGEVVRFEYICFACYVDLYKKLPKFNNKKESKKYSLVIGRNQKGGHDL